MIDSASISPPAAPSTAPETSRPGNDGPVGIGGWLILPILGLVVTPLRGAYQLFGDPALFEAVRVLDGAPRALVIFEIIANAIILLVFPIVLLVLAFRKSESFPGWFIIWAAASVVLVLADLLLSYLVVGDLIAASGEPFLDEGTLREVARSVLNAAIWIPYMLKSDRVANTFVN
jgi:hypothetical protein